MRVTTSQLPEQKLACTGKAGQCTEGNDVTGWALSQRAGHCADRTRRSEKERNGTEGRASRIVERSTLRVLIEELEQDGNYDCNQGDYHAD